jgi:ketosteroid isomerase-like protein
LSLAWRLATLEGMKLRAGALLFVLLPGCSCDGPSKDAPPAPVVTTEAAKAPATAPHVASTAPRAHIGPAPTDPFAARAAGHEKTIRALVAAFNAHDPAALGALYDPSSVSLSPSRGGVASEIGQEPVVVGHQALFASQPDVKSGIVRLLLVGDYAVEEWATTGTAAASGKAMGFRAASVFRFGGDGKIARDATYFDQGTLDVQTGKKTGEARAIPVLPAKAEVVVAGDAARDAPAVEALKKLHAALGAGRAAEVAGLLADEVVETNLFATKDQAGRDAVAKELGDIASLLPRVEVTGAWGNAELAAAEVVLRGAARDGAPEATLHVVHVVELAGGRIARSTLYGNRRELEDD